MKLFVLTPLSMRTQVAYPPQIVDLLAALIGVELKENVVKITITVECAIVGHCQTP